MPVRPDKLLAPLERLDSTVAAVMDRSPVTSQAMIARWRSDAAALSFHLRTNKSTPVTVVLGGTGTGKSTLVNRLIGSTVSAASFRRTFTAGAVAVVSDPSDLPANWLGLEHVAAETIPARGTIDSLVYVTAASVNGVLVDTPDLDGDTPAHHLQADRAFRWAHQVIFVVTPEKYQMTELLPYYRLAHRYGIAAYFVMNKCEEAPVVSDFARVLETRDWPEARIFVVPRDDAGFEPAADANLDALRIELKSSNANPQRRIAGLGNRVSDVATRLADQVIAPLQKARREIDQLIESLRAMEASPAGIDVNPITQQLQRRMQQRSVLYLIGPQRMFDRVRQLPTLVSRLPRATWDWVMRGDMPADLIEPKVAVQPGEPPDFKALLSDQFTVVRSRVDDVVRSNPLANQWVGAGYSNALLPPTAAGDIAEEEIAKLKAWLETRWNSTPRDTKILQALLKYLPGGKKLTRWSEAAPYLLAVGLVVHHALFGMDLLVLGGYSLATWLTERISNEVSSHTRATNNRIADRFENLAHRQIESVCQWLDSQAPTTRELEQLVKLADDLVEAAVDDQ